MRHSSVIRFSALLLLSGAEALCAEDHSGHSKFAPSGKSAEESRVPIEVPIEQQTRMGVRTTRVEAKTVEHEIRTVGVVTADQAREAHFHTRINGWIETIVADSVGKAVKKNETLFELYSPDLVSTQEELLAARKQPGIGAEIARAATERLKLWGVSKTEIDSILKTGKSRRKVPFRSPVDGYIVKKAAIQGMYVTPEMELYHIADLSKVWLVVTLYENDVAAVKVGDAAQIELPHSPGKMLSGRVSYIYPEVDVATRTAKARIELPNVEQSLKPGMFAQVEIKKDLGNALVVQDDSVIDTGTRKIVFAKVGQARFEPREVKVGPRVGEFFTILGGLKSGEEIVTSAHFLLDAESRLQAALRRGEGGGGAHSGHGKP